MLISNNNNQRCFIINCVKVLIYLAVYVNAVPFANKNEIVQYVILTLRHFFTRQKIFYWTIILSLNYNLSVTVKLA